jgi:hypothetical protein
MWKNEDDIKAELRTLTDELRRLREELRGMVEPKKPSPSRTFLHRSSWPRAGEPGEEPRAFAPKPDLIAEAADKNAPPTRKRRKK